MFFFRVGMADLKDRFEKLARDKYPKLRAAVENAKAWGPALHMRTIWELGCVSCVCFMGFVLGLVTHWRQNRVCFCCGSVVILQTIELKNLRRRCPPSMANQRGWPSCDLRHPLTSFDLSGSEVVTKTVRWVKQSSYRTHRAPDPQRLGMWSQDDKYHLMAIRGFKTVPKEQKGLHVSHAACGLKCFFIIGSNSSVQVVCGCKYRLSWSSMIYEYTQYISVYGMFGWCFK